MTEREEPQVKNFLLYLLLLVITVLAVVFLFSKDAGVKNEETNKEATNSTQNSKQ